MHAGSIAEQTMGSIWSNATSKFNKNDTVCISLIHFFGRAWSCPELQKLNGTLPVKFETKEQLEVLMYTERSFSSLNSSSIPS